MLRKVIVERRKRRSRIYLAKNWQLEQEVNPPEPDKITRKRMASESFRATGE